MGVFFANAQSPEKVHVDYIQRDLNAAVTPPQPLESYSCLLHERREKDDVGSWRDACPGDDEDDEDEEVAAECWGSPKDAEVAESDPV